MVQIGPSHRVDGYNELQVRGFMIATGKLRDGHQFQVGLGYGRGGESRESWRGLVYVWDIGEDLNDRAVGCDSQDVGVSAHHGRK